MSLLFSVEDELQGDLLWYRSESPKHYERISPEKSDFEKAKSITLIVSGENILVTRVVSGVRSNKDFEAAALFTLEEEIAEPLNALHVVPGDRAEANSHGRSLAIVSTETMSRWLTVFREQFPDAVDRVRVIPDTTLLPETEEGFAIWTADRVLMANAKDRLSIDAALAGELVPAMLREMDLTDPVVQSEAGVNLPHALSHAETGKPYLDYIVDWLWQGRGTDLRYGAFAPRGSVDVNWDAWRSTLGLVAVCLLLWLGSSAWRSHQLNTQTDRVFEQMVAHYQTAFPGERRPANPAGQLAGKARALSGGEASASFVATFSTVYNALEKVEGVEIRSATFLADGGRLSLGLVFESYEARDALNAAFQGTGLNLTLGGTRRVDDFIEGDASVEVIS